jgi:hypothetical protein
MEEPLIYFFLFRRTEPIHTKKGLEARNQKRQPVEEGDCYSIASFGLKIPRGISRGVRNFSRRLNVVLVAHDFALNPN